MIDHLDTLLFRLFRWRITELTTDLQVRFQPPDQSWLTMVSNSTGNCLNVYLADLRENRRLRTNERPRSHSGSDVYELPPPRRVDCHYLISAWSPAPPTPGLDTTPDEHALLAETALVLGRDDVLDPAPICAATRPPNLFAIAVPPPLAGELLPVTVLPVEGFSKYAEFWGTMGSSNRWKPCVYAVITIPLKESPVRAGPMVTTLSIETATSGASGSGETFLHIGGTLRATGLPNAAVVPGATVELLTTSSVRRQVVRTDVDGRFVFVQVAPGDYLLRFGAVGFGSITSPVLVVPAPSGSYDIHF